MDTTFHFTPSSTHLTTSQIEALLNNSNHMEIWKLLLQTFGAVEPWQLGFTSPHENPFKIS